VLGCCVFPGFLCFSAMCYCLLLAVFCIDYWFLMPNLIFKNSVFDPMSVALAAQVFGFELRCPLPLF
jgi:hypothetical protein